jgi:carboxylesterase
MASSGAKADRAGLRGTRVPHELVSAGATPNVLAIHGFGGTPFEMELVVETATELGLGALAPLLPGHGTSVLDLSKTRFGDWSIAIDEALARLKAPAIVVGLSLGSVLALDLTLREPAKVQGLVLLANAVWLRAPFPRWGLELVDRLRVPDFWTPKGGPTLGDERARQTHVSYRSDPVHSAIAVLRAGKRVRERLGEVGCPTLILHGARDALCPVSNAWRVAEGVGTSDCRVVILPRSHHVITRDVESESVRRELRQFFARFAPTPSS